jgi:uncharacterized damage-inducible protein DinB
MFDRKSLTGFWDHFRQVHGITLRTLDLIPADKIDSQPIQNMRSPKELISHLYGTIVRAIPEGVARGTIQPEDEKAIVARIKTKDDLIRFVNESWTAGDRAAKAITDANLLATVKTPWGFDMPGSACMSVVTDEYFHHRGQIYAFVRQLGGAPPMMWDFEHNSAEFGPKTQQKA